MFTQANAQAAKTASHITQMIKGITQMIKDINQQLADLKWKGKDWKYQLNHANDQNTKLSKLAEERWEEIKKLINDKRL